MASDILDFTDYRVNKVGLAWIKDGHVRMTRQIKTGLGQKMDGSDRLTGADHKPLPLHD
jgi:hypothetical protein